MAWMDSGQFEDEFAEEFPEDEGVKFRDRSDLGLMGRNLYWETMQNTSNQAPKELIREKCAESNEQFSDKQFPAGASSLISDWSAADHHTQKEWGRYVWKRSAEIFQHEIKVFDHIDPNDILQGGLGDCYFLSSLSALAEFPSRISALFDTQEYQSSGCYSVNIIEKGVWTDVLVDDFFPCYPDGAIAFSGPKIDSGVAELWVILLEKAWAKRFGSYMTIDAGFTEDVLRDLTGGPCQLVETSDECAWELIHSGNASNFIITAASGGADGCGDLVGEVGLVSLHAYAVIDAQIVNGNENILKIRNPWGSQEWTGAWSDSSDNWTPQLKKQLNWENVDDGTFWMSFDDFAYYFTNVSICHVHDKYDFKGANSTQKHGGFSVFRVNLADSGHTYFTVTQTDSRRFAEDLCYDYSPARIIVARETGDSLEFIKGVANAYMRDVWTECDLAAGDYLVFVELDWIEDFTDEFGFSVYSAAALTVKNVTYQQQDFLNNVYSLELAQREADPREIAPGISFYTVHRYGQTEDGIFMEGFIFDVIHNESANSVLDIEIIHKSMVNLELVEPYSGEFYKVKVKPGDHAVIVKKQPSLLDVTELTIAMKKTVSPA